MEKEPKFKVGYVIEANDESDSELQITTRKRHWKGVVKEIKGNPVLRMCGFWIYRVETLECDLDVKGECFDIPSIKEDCFDLAFAPDRNPEDSSTHGECKCKEKLISHYQARAAEADRPILDRIKDVLGIAGIETAGKFDTNGLRHIEVSDHGEPVYIIRNGITIGTVTVTQKVPVTTWSGGMDIPPNECIKGICTHFFAIYQSERGGADHERHEDHDHAAECHSGC